ncbi:uncharacterized protein LOC142606238 [Castanea sativa]|uniref:uncharacterized protein LOC142606238 n=1 Tax=Castanea sativa TaxID=21020 RepID=UPI003F64A103
MEGVLNSMVSVPADTDEDSGLGYANQVVFVDVSMGYEVVFVVVDRLTKYVHFLPLSHPFTATKFWKELFRLQGIELAMSFAYHPQSDGQIEVNTGSSCGSIVTAETTLVTTLTAEFGDNSVGDWVYLKLQPYRQFSLRSSNFHKLSPRYYGPFQILQRIGKVAYKLDLPTSCSIHPVFHISCLKLKLGSNVVPIPTLPHVDDDGYKYLKIGMDLVDKVFFKGKGMIRAEAVEVSHAELEVVMLSWSYSVMVVTSC